MLAPYLLLIISYDLFHYAAFLSSSWRSFFVLWWLRNFLSPQMWLFSSSLIWSWIFCSCEQNWLQKTYYQLAFSLHECTCYQSVYITSAPQGAFFLRNYNAIVMLLELWLLNHTVFSTFLSLPFCAAVFSSPLIWTNLECS